MPTRPADGLAAPLRLTTAQATAAIWSDGRLTIQASDAGVELTLTADMTGRLCRYLDRLQA